MIPRSPLRLLLLSTLLFLGTVRSNAAGAAAATITWTCSTATQPSQVMPPPTLISNGLDAPPLLLVHGQHRYQKIDGFGGCFNELGWQALASISPEERDRTIGALFGEEGCAFTLARVPIGASDFALDGYSLADTADDFELKHFSIDRDRRHLLPFIHAAMKIRPELRCWASPWSPPAWMKTNNSYSKGALKWDPAILRTYADYFAAWIAAYRAEGVNIYAVTPQNEPNILNIYPTCEWSGPQLREFIADYLGPTLRRRVPRVEIWLGLNGDPSHGGENINDRLRTVLEDPAANAFITTVGYQYDSRQQLAVARELYPSKAFAQTETKCYDGKNSWEQALQLFSQMQRYLEGGASAYFMWNMVLDETGSSSWKWRQNAMITVDRPKAAIAFNGEYHVMRHFSRWVKPGASRVLVTGPVETKIAFQNADGSLVVVVANTSAKEQPCAVALAGDRPFASSTVALPPQSVSTFVVSTGPKAVD